MPYFDDDLHNKSLKDRFDKVKDLKKLQSVTVEIVKKLLEEQDSRVSSLINSLLADVNSLLGSKVDKETGKSLMSDAEHTKLNGIASGAEVNVQSDWGQSDTTADDYIKNKPTTISGYGITDAYTKSDVYTKTDVDALLGYKQDTLSFDNVPVENSNKPVKSGGIYTALENLREVAEGKCNSYTISTADNLDFDTQNSSISGITSITTTSNDVINVTDLKNGDVILVTELEAPDRWYSAGDGKFYILETAKVDLDNYYTKTQVDTSLSGKQDTLTSGTSIKTINNTSVLGSGDIDTKELYKVTYGVTTYAQVTQALTNGKLPYVMYDDMPYFYNRLEYETYKFVCILNGNYKMVKLHSLSDYWDTETFGIQLSSYKSTDLSNPSNLTYPSTLAVSNALAGKVDKVTGYSLVSDTDIAKIGTSIQGVKKNGTSITPDANGIVNVVVPTQASDISALPSSTKYGSSLSLSINTTTYVVTLQLKDQDGNNLGSAQTIDLPLESVVVSGSYDSVNKKVVLTLQSGSTIEFSVADLVSGLQTEITSQNKLSADYVDDTNTTNKFVTASDKTTWNGKSTVSVSNTGTATDEVQYITIDGVEKKIGGAIYVVDLGTITLNSSTSTTITETQYNGLNSVDNAFVKFTVGTTVYLCLKDHKQTNRMLFFDERHAVSVENPLNNVSTVYVQDLGNIIHNPMTSQGDLITTNQYGLPVRLGKGTNGQVLKSTENGIEWDDESGGSAITPNPSSSSTDELKKATIGSTVYQVQNIELSNTDYISDIVLQFTDNSSETIEGVLLIENNAIYLEVEDE